MSYSQFSGEIQWNPGFSAEMFVHARDLGAMVINASDGSPYFRMLLYHAAGLEDTGNLRATVGWDNLPENRQKFLPNAKGTGLYAGVAPRSVAVFADGHDGDIGAYLTPEINRYQLLDRRDGDPGKMTDLKVLARSTARFLGSKISARGVVQHVDHSYRDARGVLLTPAPTVMAKEVKRRGPFTDKPGWLLWRDPDAALIRIGTIAA